jgi:hypothetical protein
MAQVKRELRYFIMSWEQAALGFGLWASGSRGDSFKSIPNLDPGESNQRETWSSVLGARNRFSPRPDRISRLNPIRTCGFCGYFWFRIEKPA